MRRIEICRVLHPEKYGEELLPYSFRSAWAHLLCCVPLVALILLFGICAFAGGWRSHLHFMPSPAAEKHHAESKASGMPLEDKMPERALYRKVLRDMGIE